jgi:hypothetical protein
VADADDAVSLGDRDLAGVVAAAEKKVPLGLLRLRAEHG